MDVLGFFWIPDFLIWTMMFIVVLYVYGTWPFSKLASLGYQGPKPKPFVGNLDLLFRSGHFGAWFLTGKRQYGKVFAMYEGRLPNIVVFDTDVLKRVLVKDFANFTDRRDMYFRGDVMSHSLLDAKGAKWKRIRTIYSPFFTTGKLKRNMQLLNECVKNLKTRCDEIAERRTDMDVKDVMGSYTLEAICLTAFGIHVDSLNDPNHKLLQTMKATINSVNSRSWMFLLVLAVPFVVPLLERLGVDMWPPGIIQTFSDLTKEVIEERRTTETEHPDFLQSLIKAHEVDVEPFIEGLSPEAAERRKPQRPLTDKEIVAQVIFFLGAAYDTVSSALAFMLFNLAENPDCQERLVQEIDDIMGDREMTYENLREMTYLNMCLEESLRLFPPALRTDRKCLNDTTVNGYFIPKDTLITVPIYSLHRDPELWKDPEKFDPERFCEENRKSIETYTYMPFGMGPRNCVGMRLAQIEVKIALVTVLKHFHVRLSRRTKLPVKLVGVVFPRAEGGLWIQLEKRLKVQNE